MEADSIKELFTELIAPLVNNIRHIREALLSKEDLISELEVFRIKQEEELRLRDEKISTLENFVQTQEKELIDLTMVKIPALELELINQGKEIQSLKDQQALSGPGRVEKVSKKVVVVGDSICKWVDMTKVGYVRARIAPFCVFLALVLEK